MKKTFIGCIMLFIFAAFAPHQPVEVDRELAVTVFNNPEYDEVARVVDYGPSYHWATANAFCSHVGYGLAAGYSIASGTVDGYYAWYQTSWYVGNDEGGYLFSQINCYDP